MKKITALLVLAGLAQTVQVATAAEIVGNAQNAKATSTFAFVSTAAHSKKGADGKITYVEN